MNRCRIKTVTISLALVASAGLLTAGPLTPPGGPVASSYKTLSEVEPRIAINAANTPGDANSVYRITQPGSYYLTGNVLGQSGKHGIEVVGDNVTIDLCGFEVRGVGGALSGITDSGDELLVTSGLTVRNGSIVGFPAGQIYSFWCGAGRFEDLRLSGPSYALAFNGVCVVSRCTATGSNPYSGFELQEPARVESCIVKGYGVGLHMSEGTVSDCTAESCQTGFTVSGSIEGSRAQGCGVGIELNGAVANACVARACNVGIDCVGSMDAARGCTVTGATNSGIRSSFSRCTIQDNVVNGTGPTGTAILVTSGATRAHIEGNAGLDNGFGVQVAGTDCTIIRNSFGKPNGSNANYMIAAGNRFGTIVHSSISGFQTTVGSATATVAGTMTASDPFANLSY